MPSPSIRPTTILNQNQALNKMVYIASVYGEWVRKDNFTWHFEVDYRKGGRMFSLRDGCTHDELIQMASDDYSVIKIGHRVELSYPLPEAKSF